MLSRTLFCIFLCLPGLLLRAEYRLQLILESAQENTLSLRYASNNLHFLTSFVFAEDKLYLRGFLVDSPQLQFGSFTEEGVYARLARHSFIGAWSQSYTRKNRWSRNYTPSSTIGTRLILGALSLWQRHSEDTNTLAIDSWVWRTERFAVYTALLHSTRIDLEPYDSWIIEHYPSAAATIHYALIASLRVGSLKLGLDTSLSTSLYESPRPMLRFHAALPFETNTLKAAYSYYDERYRDRRGAVPSWHHEVSAEMRNVFSSLSLLSRFLYRYRYAFAEFPARWEIDTELRCRLNQSFSRFSLQEDFSLHVEFDTKQGALPKKGVLDAQFQLKNNDMQLSVFGQLSWLPEEAAVLQEKLTIHFEWKRPFTLGIRSSVEFHENITLGTSFSIGARIGDISSKIELQLLEDRPIDAIQQFSDDIVLTWSLRYSFKGS